MAKREDVAKALVVAAEVLGHELSPVAALAMARELAEHEQQDINTALRRCTRELRGRLALADVLERLPGRHLGAEEAWALCPRGEDDTVVWTDEIAQAFGVARPLLLEGDRVGARMAFKEAYARLTAAGGKPQWMASMGHDTRGRVAPVMEAVRCGRLPRERAAVYLAGLPGGESELKRLEGSPQSIADLLPAEVAKHA